MDERLSRPAARKLIREILRDGETRFSLHALAQMKERGLSELDCVNGLRGGHVIREEFENGSWRYTVRTQRLAVVVAFRSRAQLVVITAWRLDR